CAWPCEPEAVAGPQCEPQARRACERGRASRSRRRGEPVSTEPVAIIAAGAVTPIGADLDAFWTGLVTGTDGVSRIERFPVGDLRVGLGGEVKKPKRERRGGCRASQPLFAAADDLRARAALRARTRGRVRPFARRRSGLLLGEGAALVLLARDRDAGERRLGRLLGHASASDGAHVAAPDPEGRGLEWAIRAALAEAEV